MTPLCLQLLQNPLLFIEQATDTDWTLLIHQAREQALLGSCYFLLQDAGLYDQIPDKVKTHFYSGYIYAQKQKISLMKEMLKLEPFFSDAPYPCVLLKGCAYRLSELPMARGRVFSDIDLLVPQQQFPDALQRLNEAGFIEFGMSEYDRRYYLRWSHQHPPLIHYLRGVSIDLHHHIYPVSSHENILIEPILSQSIRLEGSSFAVPTKSLMFVHACVHLFYQDETHKLIKDLWDLYQLYLDAMTEGESQMVQAAIDLNAQAAVYYAFDVLQWLFNIDVSEQSLTSLKPYANHSQRRSMRWLLAQLFDPKSGWHQLAHFWWTIRGHLLKMGPMTLLYHSVAKSIEQYRERRIHTAQQRQQDALTKPKDAGLL
ncbi:MAG: nucleotidyltransferase family protein [Rheinheimera sp.]